MHDLLPLPYTEEAIRHVADRISRVQDYIGRQMLIENLSSYITYATTRCPNGNSSSRSPKSADCYLLLDVNNIYVSSYNHRYDPLEYLDGVPAERVWQHHLAGHTNDGNLIIDTHDQDVIDPVWALYEETAKRLGPVSTMIERDGNIPELSTGAGRTRACAQHIAEPWYNKAA